MTKRSYLSVVAAFAGSICLTQAAVPEPLTAAIQKLADADNYSWTSKMESSRWNPAPTIGKATKGGPTLVTRSFGENTIQSVHLGDKALTQTQEGWRSLAELEADESDNRNRFTAWMLRSFTPPATEAAELVKNTEGLTLSDGVYAGKLSEEQVKSMLSFGGGGGQGPEVRDAAGSVRLWVKEGVLVKYQTELKGSMTWNNNDMEMDRTTTIEITEIGTTKVEIPAAAKEKLS